MAAFVSVASCHHCPVLSSRRGLVYRDSLSALSWKLNPAGPHHRPCRLARPDLPQSKPPGNIKNLVLAHLKKLLTLSSPQERGLRLPV